MYSVTVNNDCYFWLRVLLKWTVKCGNLSWKVTPKIIKMNGTNLRNMAQWYKIAQQVRWIPKKRLVKLITYSIFWTKRFYHLVNRKHGWLVNLDFEGGSNYTLNHENANQSFSLTPTIRGETVQILAAGLESRQQLLAGRDTVTQATSPTIKHLLRKIHTCDNHYLITDHSDHYL